MADARARLSLLAAARTLLAERGLRVDVREIADVAGVERSLAALHFPSIEDAALALYGSAADELERACVDLPRGHVGARFRFAMERKLEVLAPHREAWRGLMGAAFDVHGRARVLGPATRPVRARVRAVFHLVARDAAGARSGTSASRLGDRLYALHLMLVLAWAVDESAGQRATAELLDVAAGSLSASRFLLPLLEKTRAAQRLDAAMKDLVAAPEERATEDSARAARAVLDLVFAHRRVHEGLAAAPSDAAFALHLPRVQAFVEAGRPVEFVLPGFPAKAPNPEKVLGRLPDAGERLAISFLGRLLDDMAHAHPPGGRLVICSDGHVFADVVGVTDEEVDSYRAEFGALIQAVARDRISVFTLEEAFGESDPARARAVLLERYAASTDEIVGRAARSRAARLQLDGIHRFLFEDEVARGTQASRSKARAATKSRAAEVVRRSDAWSRLVADAFPAAVRLSIHPQPDVSDKIGLHLLPTHDAWLTPWQGSAVFCDGRFSLMKRRDAEARGARVVLEDGRPSHLEMSGS